MPLPVNILPIEEHIKRFPIAIQKIWDVETILEDGFGDRPGLNPEYIFDIELDQQNQFRYIVSNELRQQFNHQYLHISFSSIKHNRKLSLNEIIGLFNKICGFKLEILDCFLSKGYILHFICSLPPKG